MALPDSITGLQHWWRGDDLGANGGSIASWPAVATTGGGVALAQATSGSRPTVVGATSALNGAKSALFDGVDDYLAATIAAINQPLTLFAVVNALVDQKDLFTSAIFGAGFGAGGILHRAYQYAGTATLDSDADYSAAGIFMFVASGSSSANYQGTSALHATTGTNPGTGGIGTAINVGRNINTGVLNWNGHIAELGVYDSALDSTKREILRAGLAAKYFPSGVLIPVVNHHRRLMGTA